MANPPVRPWFRLTSIRPVPTPAPPPPPAPAPDPRPTLSLPTYRSASAPSSPHLQPQDKSTQHQQQRTNTPPSPPPRKTPHLQPSHPQDKTTQQQHRTHTPSSPPRKTPHPQPSHPQPQEKTTQQQRTITPSSPPRKIIPSSSSLPSSPIQKTSHSTTVPVPFRSPIHSPNSKSSTTTTTTNPRPPSPLTLPPSQFKPEQQPKIPMEAEHKDVLVQKTVVDKPNPRHNNSSSAESHRETRNAHHGKHHVASSKERENKERKVWDSDDAGNMRVITIAGENRGAYMELIHSPKKHNQPKYLHKKGNLKDGESEGSSVEEGNKNKDKNHKGRTTSSFPMAAYMNSNVQCVNNSLLYHASCSHHDPGLHLSLKKKPSAEGYHFKEHVNGLRNT